MKRKRFFLGPNEEDILRHLTAGDLLMSFLLSARSSRLFYREAYKRAHARYRCKRTIGRLEAKGLITRQDDAVHLTQRGKELTQILALRRIPDETPWKGTWWIVMYDIPVTLNPFRFELRRILIRAGFRKLQHSVWIHSHACKELKLFLRDHPRLAAYIRYLETPPFAHMETMRDWRKLSTA